jgi:hypothetical protein
MMGRREVTTAETMLVLCGILVLGAVWGWKSLFAEVPKASFTPVQPSPSCTPEHVQKGQRVRSTQVRVSVYNSGNRSGLADRTLAKLANRGFKIGEVGNAPDRVEVRRVEVWAPDKKNVQARLVAIQFGRHTKIRVTEKNLGPGVDVIVGNDLEHLSKKAPESVRVHNPERICVPVDELATLDN